MLLAIIIYVKVHVHKKRNQNIKTNNQNIKTNNQNINIDGQDIERTNNITTIRTKSTDYRSWGESCDILIHDSSLDMQAKQFPALTLHKDVIDDENHLAWITDLILSYAVFIVCMHLLTPPSFIDSRRDQKMQVSTCCACTFISFM